VSRPYLGTWPKLGYMKQSVLHTASHIDRVLPGSARLQLGAIRCRHPWDSMRAGSIGQRAMDKRRTGPASLALHLDPVAGGATDQFRGQVEARALDGMRGWQDALPRPLLPNGIGGPIVRSQRH
jgi:hypothetical protein